MSDIFLKKIEDNKKKFLDRIVLISTIEEFRDFRIMYCGVNGILDFLTEDFKMLSHDDKRLMGKFLQEFKKLCIDTLKEKEESFFVQFPVEHNENFNPLINDSFDTTGKLHLYTIAIEDIRNYFSQIGFEIVEGPVVETEEFNFTVLNIPEDHPARADSDTFWIKGENKALRTQTSSIQVREARKRKAPFGIIAPGKVFRNEATDASHDYMFYQMEGLYLDKNASISTLLYTIREFLRFFFNNNNLEIRTRPFHFPFVEPGLEIDLECPFCKLGCSTCKKSKWIEIAGAGMVHPKVMEHMHQDDNVKGWAFGFGLTRLIMLKYNINDIRLLHNN
jgi:phenylalanyl-tRNA synthetase alpha chain